MSDQKVKRYGPQSHPMELFYEDAQGAFVLASDYEVLEARVSALEADNASLRASLAQFKGDCGKLVDLEGQAEARVAALEAELAQKESHRAWMVAQLEAAISVLDKGHPAYGPICAAAYIDTRPLTPAEIEQVKKFAEEYKAFHPTSEAG